MSTASAVLLASMPLACSSVPGTPAPPKPEASAPVPVPERCRVAGELYARAGRLFAEGKLDRTTRVLAKAERLCPEKERDGWASHVTALAELGRSDEARALARRILGAAGAPGEVNQAANAALAAVERREKASDTAEARASLRALSQNVIDLLGQGGDKKSLSESLKTYIEAWDTRRPDGEDILIAALAKGELGDAAGAQRLFDRAAVELEKSTGERVRVEVPNGLPEAVKAVAWSPNGARLALAHNKEISIFSTLTWLERTTLKGHEDQVNGVAFSGDSTRLASVSDDKTARIWDVATGAQIHQMNGHSDYIYAVAFSRNGLVATGSLDTSVRLWDAASGEPVRAIPVNSPVRTVAFDPDGKLLAAGSADGLVRVFHVGNGALRLALPSKRNAEVQSVAFSADGRRIAAGATDGIVRLWDAQSGAPTRGLIGHTDDVSSVIFSPAGGHVVSASWSRELFLWDPRTGARLRALSGHSEAIRSLAFEPNGTHFLSASQDDTVRVWTSTGAPSRTLKKYSDTVRSAAVMDNRNVDLATIALAPDGKRLAMASDRRGLRVWDAGRGGASRSLRATSQDASMVVFSPDGGRVASASMDGSVRLWDAASGASLGVFEGHSGGALSAVFSPGGGLAAGSRDGRVRLWDVKSGSEVWPSLEHKAGVVRLALSRDGERLASASLDGAVELWDARTGAHVKTIQEAPSAHGQALAFSPDGEWLAGGFADNLVRLWDLRQDEGALTLAGHGEAVTAVAFSPDGEWLASGSRDKKVRLWDVAPEALKGTFEARSGKRALATPGRVLEGLSDKVASLMFLPGSGLLAAALADGSVELWRMGVWARAATLRALADGDAGYVLSAAGEEIEFLGPDACLARDLAMCRAGLLTFSFPLCEERAYSPGLYGRLLAGATPLAEPEIAIAPLVCGVPEP